MENMTDFKRKQMYTILDNRLQRLSKAFDEVDKGLKTVVDQLRDCPDEQCCLWHFREDLQKFGELVQLMTDVVEARKKLAVLKLEIDQLANGTEEEELEDSYYW